MTYILSIFAAPTLNFNSFIIRDTRFDLPFNLP
jgi:hypothetical protein